LDTAFEQAERALRRSGNNATGHLPNAEFLGPLRPITGVSIAELELLALG
jgi:hypothetical protein